MGKINSDEKSNSDALIYVLWIYFDVVPIEIPSWLEKPSIRFNSDFEFRQFAIYYLDELGKIYGKTNR